LLDLAGVDTTERAPRVTHTLWHRPQAELILDAAVAEHGSVAGAEKPDGLLRAQLVYTRALQACPHPLATAERAHASMRAQMPIRCSRERSTGRTVQILGENGEAEAFCSRHGLEQHAQAVPPITVRP
jgi:hypothetical protein